MKKKVVKKVGTKSSVSKKAGKKSWHHLAPFKFSIISVAILGCLTLVTGGLCHAFPQADVLGTAITKSNTPLTYVEFITGSSSITSDKYDLGVYVNAYKDSKYSDLSGEYIITDLKPGKVVPVIGVDPKFYITVVPFVNYRVGNKTNNYYGEKGVTGNVIITSPTAYQYPNHYPNGIQCTQSKPCKFTAKLVSRPTPIPTPTPYCPLYTHTVCYGKQLCTQIGSKCSTVVHYSNCVTRAGVCGIPQDKTCSSGICEGSGACRANGSKWTSTCTINGSAGVCCQ